MSIQWHWKPIAGLLAPFLLLVLVACGAPAATATPAPAMDSPPAAGDTPQPTPVTEATPVSPPPASPDSSASSAPTGTLSVGAVELGRFMGHPSLIRNPALFVASTIPVGEGLMTADNETNPIPLIAESWEVSDDYTTWTFKLRNCHIISSPTLSTSTTYG